MKMALIIGLEPLYTLILVWAGQSMKNFSQDFFFAWLTCPLEVISSTMTPWEGPKGPKTVAVDILQDYMSCGPILGSQKAIHILQNINIDKILYQ